MSYKKVIRAIIGVIVLPFLIFGFFAFPGSISLIMGFFTLIGVLLKDSTNKDDVQDALLMMFAFILLPVHAVRHFIQTGNITED